jgi:hypothetical protein
VITNMTRIPTLRVIKKIFKVLEVRGF